MELLELLGVVEELGLAGDEGGEQVEGFLVLAPVAVDDGAVEVGGEDALFVAIALVEGEGLLVVE